MEYTLNWIPRFDPRSLDHRIKDLAPDPTQLKGRNRVWKRTIWLDQGSEGACTGFGFAHVYGTTPRRKSPVDDAFARQRYYRARQEDEWPGENYDGSSVLGAMEAARKDGLILSYRWATTLEEIVYALSYYGPVEIGVNWYTGMFDTDSDGFIHPTGKIEGGHAPAIGGVNMTHRYFVIFNSWGKDWGMNGSARISFDDLDRLRREQGEFALPKKPMNPRQPK